MGISRIIGQFGQELSESGLEADVRFFHSPDIRAIYYQGHLAISTQATLEEAREILQTACQAALRPVDQAWEIISHLYIVHDGSVAVWKKDSFARPSKQTA